VSGPYVCEVCQCWRKGIVKGSFTHFYISAIDHWGNSGPNSWNFVIAH